MNRCRDLEFALELRLSGPLFEQDARFERNRCLVEETAEELELLLLKCGLPGLPGKQNHTDRASGRRQQTHQLHAGRGQTRGQLVDLGRKQPKWRELVEPHQGPLTLELVVEDTYDRQLLGEGIRTRLPDQRPPGGKVECRKPQTEQLGEALHQLRHHRFDLHLSGECLAHLDHCTLQTQPLRKKEPVHRALKPLAERFEQKHDSEGEDDRIVR